MAGRPQHGAKLGIPIENTLRRIPGRRCNDNSNVCWLDVLIEDKLPAYCLPPTRSH
ncbi:MAG: hypothetical protein R2824_17945 [Saprospiraceae bacterium]